MKKFRDFESAREFVRALNLKTTKEWADYCKSGNKPDNIRVHPDRIYKNKGWKGFGDWLGTGTVAPQNKVFCPFTEAREFVRKLNLKNFTEWQEYCKSGNKPNNIPATPNTIYKNKGYVDLGDWLGTGTLHGRDMLFRPFKEAREFVRKLNLKNFTEWTEYCKSGNKPDDIPSSPKNNYKNKGYVDLGDWLGTGNVATHNRQYCSFNEAREFVRSLGLKSGKEWEEYCKSANKPDDIPANPDQTYKNKGYVDLGDWLGNGKTRNFRPYKEARNYVRSLGLKGSKEWFEYCASANKPDDIPSLPNRTYKKDFKGYGDWLGTGAVATFNRQYRSYKEAREFVRKLGLKNHKEWKAYCKSGNKPDDIPSHPWAVYKEWKKK